MADLRLPYINRVQIAGRLSRDAEIRATQGGKEFAKFSIPVSRKRKDKNGDMVEDVYWASVVLWGKSVEWLKHDLRKGRSVLVTGRLTQYTDKDGKTHHTQIEADECQMMDWAPKDDAQPKPAPYSAPSYEDDILF